MTEKVLKDFDTSYDMKSISLRYFNAAGADLDGEIGELHNPETQSHLVCGTRVVYLEKEKAGKLDSSLNDIYSDINKIILALRDSQK